MLYQIADLLVEMSPSGRTAAQAEVYRTSAVGRSADIDIRVDGAAALSVFFLLRDLTLMGKIGILYYILGSYAEI